MRRSSFFFLLASASLALPASAESEGRISFDEGGGVEASAAFVYDPITGASRANVASLAVSGATEVPTGLDPGGSFTIEAFADPAADLELRPRQFVPVFAFTGGETDLVAGIRRSPAPHSYHWWHVRVRKGPARPYDLARNRYNGISMVRGESQWRHLAVTWESESRTLSYFLDYRLQDSVELPADVNWDPSVLAIGGGESLDLSFSGAIDEVRITSSVLEPWNFLRRSEVELTDVDFSPEEDPALPSEYGHVDARLHYGAVGDGVHDDTEAIRRAFAENQNRVPIEYKTVYFPAGVYRISDSIRFTRFMVVRGAGCDRTVFRLDDGATGYDDPEVPKPAFAVGYEWPYVGRSRKQRAGNVIGNYLFDFSIETGSNNPGVLGLDFHCNNVGCVENVAIRSGDGGGLVGLDLKRGWPGPCLIRNLSVSGFDHGIAAAHREYSLVFSEVQLRGQRVAAIDNGGNILSLEKVVSENAVPAVRNRSGGLVVMIDSSLGGGHPDVTAIESENASLYLRDVRFGGYGSSVVETKRSREASKGGPVEVLAKIEDREIGEHFTGPFDHAYEPDATGSLGLEIRDTPRIPRPPVSEWINVLDFEDLVVDGDWASAIQAAVDAGKALVYFPPARRYRIDRDVILRGAVRTFLGGSPKTGIGNGVDETEDPSTGPALVLGDDLPVFQFDLLGTAHIRHRTPTDLVIRHCRSGHVTAGPECGALFIEDSGGKWRLNEHQRVWGRQLNPETKGVPEIVNDGGQLWVLGLKTEYLSTKIENRNGARTEILGGLMYPVHPVHDEDLPMFFNEDSDLSLVHGISVYRKNHKIYCRDVREDETRDFREWRWVAGRPMVNLYRSSRP